MGLAGLPLSSSLFILYFLAQRQSTLRGEVDCSGQLILGRESRSFVTLDSIGNRYLEEVVAGELLAQQKQKKNSLYFLFNVCLEALSSSPEMVASTRTAAIVSPTGTSTRQMEILNELASHRSLLSASPIVDKQIGQSDRLKVLKGLLLGFQLALLKEAHYWPRGLTNSGITRQRIIIIGPAYLG